jgi:hypothetical protein
VFLEGYSLGLHMPAADEDPGSDLSAGSLVAERSGRGGAESELDGPADVDAAAC